MWCHVYQAEQDPKLNIVREDVSQNSKGFAFSFIRSNQSIGGFPREKRASNSHALSCSSKYHTVKVEGVVTPPLGDAKLSLILLV